jgi:hypothetical protein
MIDEQWIGKGLEGSGHGIVELLPCHLPGETKENPEIPQDGQYPSWDSGSLKYVLNKQFYAADSLEDSMGVS